MTIFSPSLAIAVTACSPQHPSCTVAVVALSPVKQLAVHEKGQLATALSAPFKAVDLTPGLQLSMPQQ